MILTDASRAYTLIKERIITTQMAPGSVIHETDLMAELELGRTPIREALKLLEAEKLVVVSPRRGTFVADITIKDLQHVQEIRVQLDALCVRLAVERITPAELGEMRQLVKEYNDCAGNCDQDTLMNLDRRFHGLLAQASHNRLLQAECDMFYNLSLRIWYLYLDRLTPDDLAVEAFEEVLAAIETKDPERADRAIRAHIRHFQDSIRQYL